MSYQGYEQAICENGHYFHLPCTYGLEKDMDEARCPVCKAKVVWFNSVDETITHQTIEHPKQGRGYVVLEENIEETLDKHVRYLIPKNKGITIHRIKRSEYTK
ncbi:MAG: hypothetical protein AABY32_01935 [Nanoarchaeota archaeon]